MSIENDDFVEDLLKGLSRTEPMSEFEIRKFEKLIDRQTEEFKKSKRGTGFKIPVSIAASIAIAFGAAFLLSNHEEVLNSSGGIIQQVSPQPSEDSNLGEGKTNSNTSKPDPKKTNNSGGSQNSGSSTEVFENPSTSNDANGAVAKFETNLDYFYDLPKIKKMVSLGIKPGSLTSLDYAMQQCAIKQGITDSLLAFDKGYFKQQRVSVFYVGTSKKDYKIILADSDCALVSEL